MQVFISYRRSDTQAASRQLAEALKLRFGPDNVFLDSRDIAAGAEWRRETLGRVERSEVILVIIGPHWAHAVEDHARLAVRDPADEDVVRLEIETAFRHGVMVIPVLVDDAAMPAREALPRPFRPLTDVQAQTLHHTSWDRDVEALAEALEHLANRPQLWEPPARPRVARAGPRARTDAERVASYIAEGSVVLVLGSGTNSIDRVAPWWQGTGSLPDTAELARHLAERFQLESEIDDLARVSEHVSITEGRVDLCRILRELLVKPGSDLNSMHHFVARLPGRLRELGRESHQLVVTTNYDTAVERALDAVHEPYDLVAFVSTGEHKGRFVHIPWWHAGDRGARPITVPNEYVDLPIDEEGQLQRIVIVKLHGGATDLGPSVPRLRDNFVITEDDYIGYLAQGPIESLIPLQILNKIRESHCLFLGYRLRDWSVRVFLQRIWVGQRLDARSWAVQPGLELLERRLWDQLGVDVVEEPLASFIDTLERALSQLIHAY